MKFNIENIKTLTLILLIAAFILTVSQCSKNRNKALISSEVLFDKEQSFHIYVSETDEVIAEQDEIIIKNNSSLSKALADNEALAKATRRVRVETKTVYRDIILDSTKIKVIKIKDTVCAILPFNHYREFKWFNIGISINTDGLFKLDSLDIRDSISLYYGYGKWKLKTF